MLFACTRLFANNSGVFCRFDGVGEDASHRSRNTREVISYAKYSKNKQKNTTLSLPSLRRVSALFQGIADRHLKIRGLSGFALGLVFAV